ncbi:glycosyltransferase family 2 protein [Thermoflexus sp.]|uniref:glycosyltransferase family 2 protein n=1 Tax=Thermoflexus sp. TaxID=1969742 RepID=UPI0025CDA622|nr:glycosyltransferase family 2 protein [Thermoflexus sp.]MDW8179812.1 glycosyltransferase family 2 protein [Anaerolineae bacterium]MCS6962454.1 glycosyltransferase family 2 protein [Thermoflexus sp.]MCS7350361.1 glycosyltransferase family 2 protein [Thermoflexus sp.]MCX7689794.1 glycosyltransferase family 2 protein [Thermoflexus sp.]MDW8184273.1 glycosyltransferase family 2 protein [Anaerolineae bacterium]
MSGILVAILTYNRLPDTIACLESVRRLEGPVEGVLVLDNDSTDGTPQAIRRAFPEVQIWELERNRGYAAGNNLALQMALERGMEGVFLLNNDTVVDPQCLVRMLETARSMPQVGAVGPLIWAWPPSQGIWALGGEIHWRRAYTLHREAGHMEPSRRFPHPVDFVPGCGFLLRREALEAVGGFDERYFMYWEETDWCQRARRAGFSIWVDPRAQMWHKAPLSSEDLSPTTLYYMTRNRLLFFWAHGCGMERWIALAHAVHGAVRLAQQLEQRERPSHARAVREGLYAFFRRRWGIWENGKGARWPVSSG